MGPKINAKFTISDPNVKTAVAVIFNITVSLAIILVNKYLYVHVAFPNMTLTLMHFITTFACLHVCQLGGVFTVKTVPIVAMLPLAVFFCGFVVLTNLSLENNSVGTYQVAKVMTTPCVLLIQYYYYGKPTSCKILATVVPIVVGVIMNFLYDIKLNMLGTVYATLGVITTSFYQVMIGEKQKEFDLDSMQLLYYQAPISAAMLLLPVLFCEPLSNLVARSWSLVDLMAVGFSCLIAFAVNLSIYWIIGNTSALTYNMTGHTKFCLTVAAGYILFQDPLSLNQFIGLLLTLGGIVAYTHLRMKENERKKQQTADEQRLLLSVSSTDKK